MFWILLLGLVGLVIYYIAIKPAQYWKIKGIAHKTPWPLVGNLMRVILRKTSFFDSANELYSEFPNEKYNGIFLFTKSFLLIRDLELVKRICVKDFDHFTDHQDVGQADIDPLFSKNLVQLNGQEWRDMRSTLSPAFTASKMKAMFCLMSECAEQMSDFFAQQKNNMIEVELKDLFTRFTNDVIATCAFGVNCDSLKDRDNTFFKMGSDVTNFNGLRGLKILLLNFSPEIIKLLRVKIFPQYLYDFFINTVKENIDYRTKNGVVRPDILHLLMEARKGKLKHEEQKQIEDEGFAVVEESSIGKENVTTQQEISDLDIAAQAFIFFFAGFDTSSTQLSFMASELAINPDLQDKLYQEIEDVMTACNNKPTYEAIMGMKYLDMVICETLRKWPPAGFTDRKCTKTYKIDDKITLQPNDLISIPILGFHRNEKYFPDPEKFDPERFSDENKKNIVPFSYIPFGMGPRACIGSRFALLEIKVVFVYLLAKFEMVVIDKTTVPIKLSKKNLKAQPDIGFWIGLKSRT